MPTLYYAEAEPPMRENLRLTPREQKIFRQKFLEEIAEHAASRSIYGGELVKIGDSHFPISQVKEIEEEWCNRRIIF